MEFQRPNKEAPGSLKAPKPRIHRLFAKYDAWSRSLGAGETDQSEGLRPPSDASPEPRIAPERPDPGSW